MAAKDQRYAKYAIVLSAIAWFLVSEAESLRARPVVATLLRISPGRFSIYAPREHRLDQQRILNIKRTRKLQPNMRVFPDELERLGMLNALVDGKSEVTVTSTA